jgi:SAM-dependent methyltransferase
MSLDVVDLRNFYAQPLGTVARRFLSRGIRARWSDTHGQRIVGLGYATPYLGLFREDAERCLAFMPAAQGVVNWPPAGPNAAALVADDSLPLPDSSVDRVIAIHSLEMSANPADHLREIWRVLAPGGRMIVVVPNRRGIWARVETTPFGFGRPYGRGQLTALLREVLFSPLGWTEALAVPPIRRRLFLRSGSAWERIGSTLWPGFAGVIIVEATKQLYQGIPSRVKARRLQPALRPALIPPGASASFSERHETVVPFS